MVWNDIRTTGDEFRFLFENNPQPMCMYDVETLRFLAVNESAMWAFGYEREDLLSMGIEDLLAPTSDTSLHSILTQLDSNPPGHATCRLKVKGESVMIAELRSLATTFGTRTARFVTIIDVTEHVKTEEALSKSEEKFRKLAETTSSAIFFYKDNRILYMNKAMEVLLGYTKEDFDRMNIWDAIHPDHRELLQQRALARQRGEYVPARYEIMVIDKRGNTRWADFGASLIEVNGEQVIMATAVDVTERRRAEQTLRDKEATLRTLMDATSAGMFFYRGDHFSFVNHAMENITGFTKEELLGKTIWELVHPDQREIVRQRAHARQRGESVPPRYDLKINNKQGETRWLDLAVSMIELNGEQALMGTVIDITDREATAEKLRHSEKRFRALYDHNPLMCFSLDQSGVVQYVNQESVRQLGYAQEELVGASVFDVFHPDDKDKLRENFDTCLHRNGAVHSWELRKIHKNGGIIHVSEVAQLVSDPLGHPMVLIVCEDITERKHLEEQIRGSEELKARILEASQTGILVVSKEGRIVQANTEAERFYGLANSDLSKFTLQDFVHRKFWENGAECPFENFPVVQCLRTGTTQGPVTMGIRLLDDSMAWAVFTVVPLSDTIGETSGAVVTFLDITSRKKMEEDLRARETMLRALTETTTAAIFFYHNRQFPYVNNAMEHITGYTKEELRTMRFTSIVHPDHRDMVRQRAIARQQGKEISSRYELKILTKQGEVLWLDVAPSMITVNGDKVLMGTAVDITDRKKFEEELRRSEELTHRILEAVPGGIIEATQDGRVLQANLDAQRFYGISALDFLNTSVDQLATKNLWEDGSEFDAEDFPLMRCLRAGDEQSPVTFGVRRPDGGISWGVFTAVPLPDLSSGNTNGAVLTFLDITNRKHIEDALRESEERYRKFFEEDLTGDFIASSDGCILACNQAFATMFGFASVEEAMYCNLNSVYGEQQSFTALIDLLVEQKRVNYHECIARRRDGKRVHLIENLIGLFDSSGALIGAKGYIFDNTAHKLLEQHLQEVAKIEGLGRLAGGIAHDFNNLLGIIIGYSERLARSGESKVAKDAKAIGTAAQRGANLVKQLLTFARKTAVSFEEMSVNEIVEELGKLLKETFPRNIAMDVDIDPTVPLIVGDSNQIHQAVLNLCVNARDAMPSGGTLMLKTMVVSGSDLTDRFPDAKADVYAGIIVSDTGPGISEEVRGKIFEPFFSTKSRDRGTGLGLAVVYGIVNAHHGVIGVRSEAGAGATFELYFPVPASPVEGRQIEPVQKDELPSGKETILLVEDEELLRELVESLLQTRGYTVLVASDGQEAVEMFRARQSVVSLVLTDLGLPKLDGWSACKQMKELNPQIRIIIASGYLDPDAKQEMVDGGVQEFVHKPYLATELTAKVREVLDRIATPDS